MTAPLCRCGCNQELIRHSYENDRQWEKRLKSGLFRARCKRNLPTAPKGERPKPTLSFISAEYGRELKGVEKELPVRDAARLAFARSMPCALCGSVQGVHAHHEAPLGQGTMSGKTSDRNTLPLCFLCHRLRHDKGREVYGDMDVEAVIERINAAYDQRRGI